MSTKAIFFGLVGSDGAGKSTLLRLIATMIKPTQGEFSWTDHVVASRQKIKNIIGYMPQRFGLYQDFDSGRDMTFFMDVFDIPRKERKCAKISIWVFQLVTLVDRLAAIFPGA